MTDTRHAIIFDVDGTLADVRHRLHHVRKTPPDWKSFFVACVDDIPHEATCALSAILAGYRAMTEVQLGAPPFDLFILSGRPDDCRPATEAWLQEHCGPLWNEHEALLMRAAGDHRPDTVIKKEMLDGIRGQGYEVLFAVDDRPSVVAMWRENGVPVFAVDDRDWKEPQNYALPPGKEDLVVGSTWVDTGGDPAVVRRWAGECWVDDGKTLLTLMVGPSGAGKSSWLQSQHKPRCGAVYPRDLGISPAHVLSSDQFRADMLGDWRDQSENQRVFAALHQMARLRLAHGMPTVIDATNIRRKDRLACVALAPPGTRVRYVVLDRPLEDKILDKRHEVPEWVVRKQDQTFRSQLKGILAGDGLDYVDVVDLREGVSR